MKTLIPSLALLALLLSAPYVLAAGGGTSSELQEAWNRVQAQQESMARKFSMIERDAARAVSGTSVPVRQRAVTRRSTPKGQICMCASPENGK